jgi:hypothetical protein
MRAYRLGGIPYDTKPEPRNKIALFPRDGLSFCTSPQPEGDCPFVRREKASRGQSSGNLAVAPPGRDRKAEADLFQDSYDLRWFLTLQSRELRHLAEVDERASSMLAGL